MVRRKSFADMHCSVAQALDVVGDPWTLLIIRNALAGETRFDHFQTNLGIPRTTLADRLSALVDHGILDRCRYQRHPPRHEYRLTAKGRDLHTVIIALMQWGDRWSGLPEPPATLHDVETGEPVEPAMVDLRTGRRLDDIEIRPRLTAGHALRR